MTWTIAGTQLDSRFFLGTAGYPSPRILEQSIQASGAQVVTVGLKRQMAHGEPSPGSDGQKPGGQAFFQLIRQSGARLLPNTAGCHTAAEAIALARMAREVFDTHWLKLEVIGDHYTLQPDPFELVNAAHTLVKEGFEVFPYCTDDLVTCQRLLDAGCRILMPWGAPIGSGQGLINQYALRTLRDRITDVPLIIDAGIGSPMDAAQAMEMGFDGVLLNSAVSHAHNPPLMAEAFKLAIEAGRKAFEAGIMAEQDMAIATTPVTGRPFVL
ncbi:thiazole synthase [Allopusillimonas soli]|uniref:Thiazole synthase n=1 Tax=Allopusillimonas soli TaxID=659016 RepID=A0A853FC86_9BURK|nr:thiazole synthase [Allopusillimonas soli]NYT38405.1 thiazole synthase [Allopusillimonas soli]TEA72033.1 thiazole synthase [Allopusillimonas soli]